MKMQVPEDRRSGPRTIGLLDAILRDSMEPAYASRAAARREAAALDPVPSPAGAPRRHATPARGSFGRAATALGLAAVVIGVVTLRQGATVPEAAAARESLIAEVTRTTATVDDLRRQVATLTTQDDAAAAAALTVDQDGASLQARINALAALAAESSATGKGLVLTVTDTPAQVAEGQTATTAQVERGRTTDRDLQELANTLFAAGATAIDVGGIRLTATTPVRSAGETVLVGLQPVASPYVMHVIGDPDSLQTAVEVSAAGSRLRTAAQLGGPVLDVATPRQVTVAAAATVSLRFAQPVG